MESQITAVTFDVGGVLVDWNPRHLYRDLFRGDEQAMERFLSNVCTPAWNAALDAGRPFADAVAELSAVHPDKADLIDAYQSRWTEMLGGAFDDVVAIAAEVRAAGYRTYALSNWSVETFGATRSRFPFLDEFDGILISGEVGVGKPDPAIFREFLARFDLTPEATVFVDDWDRNVAAARELGIVAVRFTDPAQLRRDLRDLGLPIAQ
jgi:2-haloacid dehalogenase